MRLSCVIHIRHMGNDAHWNMTIEQLHKHRYVSVYHGVLPFYDVSKSVNETNTEVRLAPGSCTVEYKQLTVCTCVHFCSAWPNLRMRRKLRPRWSFLLDPESDVFLQNPLSYTLNNYPDLHSGHLYMLICNNKLGLTCAMLSQWSASHLVYLSYLK